MAETTSTDTDFEVVCPHCRRPFRAQLLPTRSAARQPGFKCPHCRLFVAYERVVETPDGDGA
jgi:DNA-directed RNA polymerase subunit RPC12/RpoP